MSIDPNSEPIFIVGASRSGTGLMRQCLNLHPEIYINVETHYFDDLRVRMSEKLKGEQNDKDKKTCEDYFLALDHRPYGRQGDPEKSELSRKQLQALADELGGGADSYFQAFCHLKADQRGVSRWGEKTPRHVFRISDILGLFPKGKVVCMVRDPRAVVASYRDWCYRGGFDLKKDPGFEQAIVKDHARISSSYNLLINSFLSRGSIVAAQKTLEKFGKERVYILKYEDLAISPEKILKELSCWLGVEYTPEMLNVSITSSSFADFSKQSKVSTESVERWKTKLSRYEISVIQSVCRHQLNKLGYAIEPKGFASPFIVLWEWIKLPYFLCRTIMANKSRIHNFPRYILRRIIPR